mgnify:FL=1
MAEYIEREALREILDGWRDAHADVDDVHGCGLLEDVICEVDAQTAADVAPVVHGRWDDSGRYTFPGGGTAVRCTECGCALTVSEYHLNNWNYCPVCGAKMDGERKDGGDG